MTELTAQAIVDSLLPHISPLMLRAYMRRMANAGAGHLHIVRWLTMHDPANIIEPDWIAMRDIVLKTLEHGNVLLYGPKGCGKTQLAVAALGEMCMSKTWDSPKPPKMLLLSELSKDLRATFGPNSEKTEDEVIGGFTQASLLILDELQDGSGTQFEESRVTDILATRYKNQLPTIFATNSKSEKLVESLGATIASRFQEGGSGKMACDWNSLRPQVPNLPKFDEIYAILDAKVKAGEDEPVAPRGGLKLKGR